MARAHAGEPGALVMTESDPTVVEQTLRIEARPETVWRYWTDPERMCDWWGAAAELDPRPGGAYVVEMGTGPVMRGEYVELVPHERIVFSFGWDPHEAVPAIAPGSTQVEVTLTPDGDGTILALRHTGLPDAARDEHRAGWARFLPLLAGAAGGARP
jgi:uncharacterized protein YndB with AHSA1/START domain